MLEFMGSMLVGRRLLGDRLLRTGFVRMVAPALSSRQRMKQASPRIVSLAAPKCPMRLGPVSPIFNASSALFLTPRQPYY